MWADGIVLCLNGEDVDFVAIHCAGTNGNLLRFTEEDTPLLGLFRNDGKVCKCPFVIPTITTIPDYIAGYLFIVIPPRF